MPHHLELRRTGDLRIAAVPAGKGPPAEGADGGAARQAAGWARGTAWQRAAFQVRAVSTSVALWPLSTPSMRMPSLWEFSVRRVRISWYAAERYQS